MALPVREAEATPAHLNGYVQALYNAGMSARSVARHIATLRNFYGFLTREGTIAKDPAELLTPPKQWSTLPKYLNREEVERLISIPPDSKPTGLRDRAMLEMLYATGLRVSELCALTTKDILWQQRQLRVRGKGGPYGKKTKVRVVPMSRRVRALLEHHFALRKEFPVRKRRAQGLVKEVANRAGLTKDVTPKVLRHSFAATALQKGISLATVQKILGH